MPLSFNPLFLWIILEYSCLALLFHFGLSLYSFLSIVVDTASEDLPQVIGSLQPIVAPLGGDVILPCHVEPQLNVEEMTVEWWRVDIKLDTRDPQSDYRYVHRYHDKQHKEDMKKLMYAGRTEMFTDGLKHGNISLKISNVMCFDQGSYRCQIPQLERASVIKITVALPVQQLQILMTFIGLLVSSSGEKC
ncbi:myelin-oligodendrocyte glycoprotein-like isoform X2 [Perca fluviatilis]|uniref:myelin-oligodendrocyte glycoprotein-like isoform X2 n=1 Tax=Perca fluviatilis TaxID=8168 RepID=UPI001966B125|nr:myelin-oligodendrocyte glycoprotein-like isoform X2 [Perca fluviatilis]